MPTKANEDKIRRLALEAGVMSAASPLASNLSLL